MHNRILRRLIRAYCRQVPFHKGKTRLITWAFEHLEPPQGFIRDQLKNGMQIDINPAEWIQNEIYYNGYYEVYLAEFFRKLIAPNWIIADVGAHVGQYSLIAAERGASVHAFEPNPFNFMHLQRNMQLNNLLQVSLNPLAVSHISGESFFELPTFSNTGTGSLVNLAAGSSKRVRIQTVTLDDYFLPQNIYPNLIKMDIQGVELMALQGGNRLLRSHPPVLIIEADKGLAKQFGYDLHQLIALLKDNGYVVYRLRRSVLFPIIDVESLESENLICCQPDQRKFLLPV